MEQTKDAQGPASDSVSGRKASREASADREHLPRIELLDEERDGQPPGTVYLAPSGRVLAPPEGWFKFAPFLFAEGEQIGLENGAGWVAFLGTFCGLARFERTEHEEEVKPVEKDEPPRTRVWHEAAETIEWGEPALAWAIFHEEDVQHVGEVLASILRGTRGGRRAMRGRGPRARPGRRPTVPLWSQVWTMRSLIVQRAGAVSTELRVSARGSSSLPLDRQEGRQEEHAKLRGLLEAGRLAVDLEAPAKLGDLEEPQGRGGRRAVRAKAR